jgi:hypothetical protein
MKALISFVRAMVARAVERWILGQLITLLISLGLIAAMLLALRRFANYTKAHLSEQSVHADIPQLV